MAALTPRLPFTPGPVVFDPVGCELTAEEREMVAHPAVGGIVLFRHNFSDARQVKELISACRRARAGHLLVMVDHEGGRVQRFRDGLTVLPPAAALGVQYAEDRSLAMDSAHSLGALMADELVALGVDLNLAPVVDIAGPGDVIGDRALSSTPETVAALAEAVVAGMHTGGLGAIAKHFPGHGGVVEDTHVASACDTRPLSEIEQRDLIPFTRLIARGVDGVLPAHVCFPCVDERPVGYSPHWLQEVLRGSLACDGLIISDDINMAAGNLPGGPVAAATAALAAGCDFVLSCQSADAAVALVDGVDSRLGSAGRERRVTQYLTARDRRRLPQDIVAAKRRVAALMARWQSHCDT